MKTLFTGIMTALLCLFILTYAYGTDGPRFNGKPEYINIEKGKKPGIKELAAVMNGYGFQLPQGLVLLGSETDNLGMVHYRYQQTSNHQPVDGTMWIVHTRDGKIESMNGVLYASIPAANNITLNNAAAYQAALSFVPAESYYETTELGELYRASPVLFPQANSFRLCYRFDIHSEKPLARKYVFVDATTGKIITSHDRINEVDVPGTAITAYSGSKTITTDSYSGGYRLREKSRGGGIETYNLNTGTSYSSATDFSDADNTWNNVTSTLDQYATDAHFGAEMSYDFYKTKFNRNSVDNAGMKLLSYVHFATSYLNAFWDGTKMTYGDGSYGYTPLTSLDICGHEMSHAVTQFTSNLIYSYESGALNEGFSDCMGTAIEFYGKTSGANWTMGEDIGNAFRNMANPKQFQQPNTYLGSYWYTGASDNGGVHTNSGVLNYWFYLVSMGGSGTNDNGKTYNFSGITLAKASAILYRAQTVYLFPSAQYADARTATIQAATDLYGSCSAEVICVQNAWYAVGVGTVSGSSSVSITISPNGSVCPGTPVTFTATPVNGGSAPTYQWKVNGGNVGTNNPAYTTSTLVNGDKVTCVMTSNATCVAGTPVTSNTITMAVGTLPASVTVTANPAGVICSGSPAIFTATPVNGGTTPSYQWKVNGANVGTNSVTYTTSALVDNDTVTCVMTSSIGCATGNPATSPKIIVTVITCTGLQVSFKSLDTVQVNQDVNLVNTSVGYSDFMWSFCTSVPADSPTFKNIGNPNGALTDQNGNGYTSIREEDGNFYSYTGKVYEGQIAGGRFGTSFKNTPTASVMYNGVGGGLEGVQTVYDSVKGVWCVMTVSYGGLYRTNIGPSLLNPYSYFNVQRWTFLYLGGMTYATDLQFIKFRGNYYGFFVNQTGSFFVTMDFGNSLFNNPSVNTYTFPTAIGKATGICVRYNQLTNRFILFVCSSQPQQLARFDLGPSPGGIPTFVDATNPFSGLTGLADVAIIQSCNDVYGLALFSQNPRVHKFHFQGNNISGAYSNHYLLPLSLTVGMNSPCSFSEFFNADTTSAARVMFITDRTNQLIRLDIDRCTNAVAPSTHMANPGPFIFTSPGTYTITLTGGIGTAYEETYCRTVYVKPCFSAGVASVKVAVNPGSTFCPGTTVTFTATPTNGGTAPVYQWKLNGVDVGTNSPTYITSTLVTGDQVACQMTSNAPCITGSPCMSDTTFITTLPTEPAAVTISVNPGVSVCSGKPVTFMATSTNIGTLSYQWKVNGVNVGTNSTSYVTTTLNNNDTVTCELTSTSLCVVGQPGISNRIIMTVIPSVNASLIITATPNDTICAGVPVTFTAVPANGGATPVYQWKLYGGNVGSNSPTYTNSTLANNNTVMCVLTSNAVCVNGSPATSNTIKMTVFNNVVAAVNVTASPGSTVCRDKAVTFTAVPASGATPAYQWKLNSTNVGTNSATYTNKGLNSGDTVRCVVTLTGNCVTGSPVTSGAIIMTVNDTAVAGTISAAMDSICPWETDSLYVNGHAGYPLQWQSANTLPNFASITGADTSYYFAAPSKTAYYRLIAGVAGCPDTSAAFKLVVKPQPVAAFTYTISGLQVFLNSGTTTGNIASYFWNFGDDSTSTLANPTHTYLTKNIFTVCLTVVNTEGCSDTLCKQVNLISTGLANAVTEGQLNVYPSPFTSQLFIEVGKGLGTVESLELVDVLGRKLITELAPQPDGNLLRLDVPLLASGVYYLKVKTASGHYVVPVVRQ